MIFTKQMLQDMHLGEWIRKNKGKSFVMATPDGVYSYSHKFKKNNGKLSGKSFSKMIIDDYLGGI